jgi:uncharacterized membrane protein YbhN (UPF0104 family)
MPRWDLARWAVGLVILAALLAELGSEPFLDGLRSVDPTVLGAGLAITAVTTGCAAWRWRVVGRGLGVEVSWRPAVGAYYASQLLNLTLPGGVLGDAHRAVRHGREVGDLPASARVVVWERVLGLVAHLVITGLVLLVIGSPFRPLVAAVAGVVLAGGLAVGIALLGAVRAPSYPRPRRLGRWVLALLADLRAILGSRRALVWISLTSAVVTAGHTAVFLLAGRAAGAGEPSELLPVGLLVLLGSAIPTSLAGWGPREGVAAWTFAVAGVGATTGVTVAVAYGVIALVATLPGALVLAVRRPVPARPAAPIGVAEGLVGREGVAHG